MSFRFNSNAAIVVAILSVLPIGCRSSREKLPPDHILMLYAPKPESPAAAEVAPVQRRDLAEMAPAVAAGRSDNWRGPSTVGKSSCPSGCSH